uniref:transposase n=1 Tax=Tenacibaculum tangerinum TaxID=3038772 RepID=UPI0038997E54
MKTKIKNVIGKFFGDKVDTSKALAELIFQGEIQLITKVRKNMKKQSLSDITLY